MASPTTSKRHSYHRDPAGDGNSFRFSLVRGQDQTNGRYGCFCIQTVFHPSLKACLAFSRAQQQLCLDRCCRHRIPQDSLRVFRRAWTFLPIHLHMLLAAASHLTIYFLLCCKTCSSYHDALILGQHILRLGKNVQHVLSYFYPNPSSVLQRNPEVPIQPWLSKEFSAPRAKLPAAEISVFGNRSWNRGSD